MKTIPSEVMSNLYLRGNCAQRALPGTLAGMRILWPFICLIPAAAAPVVTISSTVETFASDWQGTRSNTSSGSSTTTAFRIDSADMTRTYSAIALASAGGDPSAGTTWVVSRAQSNFGTAFARAVATTTYRRDFEATMDFVGNPINFVPELQIFTGMFSPIRVVTVCPLDGPCPPFTPPPATGIGTIEFTQSLNGTFLNSLTLGYEYHTGLVTFNRCEPQPFCQPLDIQAGRQSGGDPAIYAPAQWVVGPKTQVRKGPNSLEYTIRATAEGTFSWYRGIQVQYADPVYWQYEYPRTELFRWDSGSASAVPEPSTGLAAAIAAAVWALTRRLSGAVRR